MDVALCARVRHRSPREVTCCVTQSPVFLACEMGLGGRYGGKAVTGSDRTPAEPRAQQGVFVLVLGVRDTMGPRQELGVATQAHGHGGPCPSLRTLAAALRSLLLPVSSRLAPPWAQGAACGRSSNRPRGGPGQLPWDVGGVPPCVSQDG